VLYTKVTTSVKHNTRVNRRKILGIFFSVKFPFGLVFRKQRFGEGAASMVRGQLLR
jgi:hypothetical protein